MTILQLGMWSALLALAPKAQVPKPDSGNERVDVFESMVASVCGVVEVRTERRRPGGGGSPAEAGAGGVRVVTISLETPFRIIGSADPSLPLQRPVLVRRLQLLAPGEVLVSLAGKDKVCASGRLTRRVPGRFEAAALDAHLGTVTLETTVTEPVERASSEGLERHMVVLGVAPERTTLEAAQMILGRTQIRNNGGDAAAGANYACYVGEDGTALVLESNTEMGGGSVITSLQLLEREDLADYSSDTSYVTPEDKCPRCASLRRLSRSTTTGGGLRLKMSVEEVLQLLGAPTTETADLLEYTSLTPIPGGDSTAREVRVLLKDGKVIGIRVSRQTAS